MPMLNACELEIDLFCKGLRVPPRVPLEGARGISRTRAGLGSGLEVVLPAKSWLKDEIWVNAPVVERFTAASPIGWITIPTPATSSWMIAARPIFRRRMKPVARTRRALRAA
jgi:hypothetical protein